MCLLRTYPIFSVHHSLFGDKLLLVVAFVQKMIIFYDKAFVGQSTQQHGQGKNIFDAFGCEGRCHVLLKIKINRKICTVLSTLRTLLMHILDTKDTDSADGVN